MAQQRFEKGTELHQMINDYLRLLQQFWVIENTDIFWEEVMNAMYEFYGKYKSVDEIFSVTMALAFLDVLEEKSRRKRGLKGKLFERLGVENDGEINNK